MARYSSYINGTAARQAAPALEPQKTPRQLAEEHRQEERRKAARLNRDRSGSFHFGHAAFLLGCTLAIALCAFTLVQTQASINSRMKHITSLESSIASKKADNDARYKAIVSSVDLDEIKDYAINTLGMTYADESQIEYYSIDQTNYMDQYSDIPQ